MDRAVRAHGLAAAARDAALPDISPSAAASPGDVRAAFVDDADDCPAETHAGQHQRRWALGPVDFGADQVGQGGDGLDRVGNRGRPISRRGAAGRASPTTRPPSRPASISRALASIVAARAASSKPQPCAAPGLFGCRRHRERLRCQRARAPMSAISVSASYGAARRRWLWRFQRSCDGNITFGLIPESPVARSFGPLVRVHRRGHRSIQGGDPAELQATIEPGHGEGSAHAGALPQLRDGVARVAHPPLRARPISITAASARSDMIWFTPSFISRASCGTRCRSSTWRTRRSDAPLHSRRAGELQLAAGAVPVCGVPGLCGAGDSRRGRRRRRN